MKILQLSKYYPPAHGGIELVAEFFSRACVELGHHVQVISLGDSTKSYTGQYGENVVQASEDIKLRSSPLSFNYYLAMKKRLAADSPDIVFVHLPHPFAHEICKWFEPELTRKGTKIVGIYHSDIINQVMLRDAYNVHFSRHLKMYDSFICASPNLKNCSTILSQLQKDKVKVLPFCADHGNQLKSIKRPERFQGNFTGIGRLVPYKGFEFLVDCFNSLPYNLTIVGNGPLKEKLMKMAKPNVKFVGSISENEKFEILNQSDALIMSSINRSEAYGMTIVEAFSIGLPVISSDIDTGVSYLVRDGVTGFKFPILNKSGLIEQIENLKRQPELTKTISSNCQDFYQQELNFPAFKKNLAKIL